MFPKIWGQSGNLITINEQLQKDFNDHNSSHDFGKDIIPALVNEGEVFAYAFRNGKTGEPAYWRDIGTLDSYYAANMDLVSRQPGFDLYDPTWLFRAWQPPVPPCKSVHGFTEDGTLPGIVEDSIVGVGAVISGGRVERSLLGRGVRVNSYSHVTDSILMDNVDIGRYAKVKRCIIDKSVVVPEGMEIGFDLEKDLKLVGFSVSQSVLAMKDGVVDAVMLNFAYPASAVVELDSTRDIDLVPMDEGLIDKIIKKHPYYVRINIPKGIYKGIDKDVLCLGDANVMVVHKDMDADLVYKCVKGLFENVHKGVHALINIHPIAKQFTPENAVNSPIPLHPGSIKYFKELGVGK